MNTLLILLQTINILLFGHSFGVDCTEYLPAMAVEAGMDNVYIGRFIKANCSLEEHYNFFAADSTGKFSECQPGETKFKRVRKSVTEAVSETKWDYVIFQTSLENEGRYSTVQPYLNDLIKFVKDTQSVNFESEPVLCWNMFWPISKLLEDGSHKVCAHRLSFYGNSSDTMWKAYVNTAKKILKETEIKVVIPSGTAVMNARETKINDESAKELTRDGYHMSFGVGRYVAACAMYETLLAPLSGKSVLGNSFRVTKKVLPVDDDETATILQRCAVNAVKNPYKVTGQ